MDSVLLGVLRSGHPPALKVALVRLLVQKSAHLAVSEEELRRVLSAGVTIMQSAPTDGLAETGALIIRQWGQHNAAVLERCALPVLLEPLLAGPVPLPARVGPALLGWLLDRLPAQQAGLMLAAARRLLAGHAAHPAHTADSLSGLAGLMLDWPQCRPRFEEAVTLSQGLIRAIAALKMPDQSGQIAVFVSQMERVGQLFQQLFSSTQTVIRSMDTLYEVMTDTGGAPVSAALSVALQAVPVKLVTPACSQLGSLKSGGGGTTCQGISLLCDWLLVWPRGARLAIWIGALVREAASSGHTADLNRLVLARIDRLFQGLAVPAVRRSVFPVVSLMLLGFQQSPAAFFKVLPRVPALLDQLRQESSGSDGADFSQLADLIQTLMRLHPSCVQRYAAVVRSLQGRPPPPPSLMASLLVSSAWTDPSSRSEPPPGEPPGAASPAAEAAPPDQRRRGLVNLGNTCYMNAVLQALYHSDQLCSEVLAARPSPSRPHLAALQRVFAFLAFSERPTYSPAEFQRVALPPWFERGRQHDCSEFLRYLLDAMHEEERVPASPAVPPVPASASPPVRPAATPRARDDTSVPGPTAADRPRPRRRHRSCDASPAPGGPPLVPLSDLVSDDVVMAELGGGSLAGGAAPDAVSAQPAGTDGCGDDRQIRTVDGGGTRTGPDGGAATGDAGVGADQERTGDGGGGGAGDSGDIDTADGGAEEPTGGDVEPTEPAAGLVRRLLTGRAETTYTCCACGSVSRHMDRVTDLHLALPEEVTRPLTAAGGAGEAGGVDSLTVFGPEPRPTDWENPDTKSDNQTEMQVDTQPAETARSQGASSSVQQQQAGSGQQQQPGSDQEQQPGSCQQQQPGSGQQQQPGSDQEQRQRCGPDPEPRTSPGTESGSVGDSKQESQLSPTPARQLGPEPAPQFGPEPAPQFGPEPAPQFGPEPASQFGPEPAPQFGPAPEPRSEATSDVQPETDLTVSDLLQHYLAPERLCGENQYHCTRCAGLRDADRQLRLLTPPPHLVVSLVRFVFDRRTGARRKVLAPVGLTERLAVPLAGRPPAQYRLYAVIVHAGHSLDAGHYFSFCRASGGGGGSDGADDGWWRLDDTSATPVTAAAALGRPRYSTEAAYTLLYRLAGAGAAGGRPPVLTALPGPLRAAVDRDNAVYRRERQGRPVTALPLLQDGRPPPGAGCGGDSGHAGPSFVC